MLNMISDPETVAVRKEGEHREELNQAYEYFEWADWIYTGIEGFSDNDNVVLTKLVECHQNLMWAFERPEYSTVLDFKWDLVKFFLIHYAPFVNTFYIHANKRLEIESEDQLERINTSMFDLLSTKVKEGLDDIISIKSTIQILGIEAIAPRDYNEANEAEIAEIVRIEKNYKALVYHL